MLIMQIFACLYHRFEYILKGYQASYRGAFIPRLVSLALLVSEI